MKAILLGGAAALAMGTGAADTEARAAESDDLSRDARLPGSHRDDGRGDWLRDGDIGWTEAARSRWPGSAGGMIDLAGGRTPQQAGWRFQARMADSSNFAAAFPAAFQRSTLGPDGAFRHKIVALRFAGAGDFGRLRFAYRRGDTARPVGEMAAMLGCGGYASDFGSGDRSIASPACLPPVAMTGGDAAFHQRRFERAWQGRGEVSRDLGGAGTLVFGADYRKTRRMFDEAGAFRPRLGFSSIGGDPWGMVSGTAIMPNDVSSTLGSDLMGDFRMKQKVFAAHTAAQLYFGAVTVTPAVVYEHTQLRMVGFHLDDLGQSALSVRALDRRRSFGDLLPSLSLAMDPAPGLTVHAAWHRRVDRPEFIELSPGGMLDHRAARLSLGNPDLVPGRGDALELAGDWSYAEGGSLGLGLFAQTERDPVYVTASQLTGGVQLNGQLYDNLAVLQPVNAQRGRIAGVQARWGQRLAFLPGALSGLALQLTARCTDAWLRLRDGTETRSPYESRLMLGTRIAYRHGRFGGAVDWLAGTPAPLTAGAAVPGIRSRAALRRLDMSTGYAVTPRLSLFLEGRNLTDEPVRLYPGSMRDWTVPNDRYGRTVYAGMQAKF
ncbi:TonB-dependent receptor [Novosphingobium sp. BL-8A]|uniref:TonB-dependent receptor n=1 Tax=Novosphingobium sp. BL-8A TaxID=3127639 RepID=UPI0037569EA3